MDKKWALPLGLALVALLILWGSLGMGTASKLFPEKPKAMPPVTASEGASSSSMLPQEESRRVYDASSYIRGKPLADPFHMEAMTEKAMPGLWKRQASLCLLLRLARRIPLPDRQKRKGRTHLMCRVSWVSCHLAVRSERS